MSAKVRRDVSAAAARVSGQRYCASGNHMVPASDLRGRKCVRCIERIKNREPSKR